MSKKTYMKPDVKVILLRQRATILTGSMDENGMNRTELKAWAKSQGWHKDDSSDYNLL